MLLALQPFTAWSIHNQVSWSVHNETIVDRFVNLDCPMHRLSEIKEQFICRGPYKQPA